MIRPIRKEKLVTIMCWDCGRKEHSHQTESSAQQCIVRMNRSPRVKFENKEAIMRVLNGERSAKIAKTYCTTKFKLDSAVVRFVERTPGYSFSKWIEIYGEPGIGQVNAAVALYKKLATS